MKVPFAELRRSYLAHQVEFDAAYHSVMQSGYYIMGPQLEAFEQEFAAFCETKYAVGVGNGLDALALILHALDVGPGDEIIVSGHTCIASWIAITQCGATVIPVAPIEEQFLLDEKLVEKLITPQTKAIMPVHLYGQTPNMSALCKIARKHNIPIVEDAAQAHGARHKGQLSGSFGLAAAFSFYPSKNLGAFGDGGAVTTSDENIMKKIKLLRNYGSSRKYIHEIVGFNSRLDELQAAFLRVKLHHLNEWNTKRNQTAALYNEAFSDLDFLKTPHVDKNDVHVWHQYVVTTPYRDALQTYLKAAGIETLIHYPIANHRQEAYADRDFSKHPLQGYENLVDTILSLPIDAFITPQERQQVIDSVCRFKIPA